MVAAGSLQPSSLDIPTLSFVAVSLAGLLGLFLILAWAQQRDVRALAWWGSAYLIGASSMAMWGAPSPFLRIPPELPEALSFLACGLIWNGVRLFHGRRIRPAGACAGALGWLLFCPLVGVAPGSNERIAAGAFVIAIYTFVIACELWRERRQSLFSRTAAVIVPSLHAAIFLTPLAMQAFLPQVLESGWVKLFALEAIIYGVGTAFVVLLMVKDHHLHIYRRAATTDHLTGLLNRRAFVENALTLCAQQGRRKRPVTLLLFDLDHFKSINDRFGHAVGDEALRIFAEIARTSTRATDVVARLGGEEFAAVLPGDMAVARKVAERVRVNFERAARAVGAHPVRGTVSIGAATSAVAVTDLDSLINRADEALYRAKHNGRNRVEAAPQEPVAPAPASQAAPESESAANVAYLPVRKRAARHTEPATV